MLRVKLIISIFLIREQGQVTRQYILSYSVREKELRSVSRSRAAPSEAVAVAAMDAAHRLGILGLLLGVPECANEPVGLLLEHLVLLVLLAHLDPEIVDLPIFGPEVL